MSWYEFLKNYDGKVIVNGKNINETSDSDFEVENIDIDIIPKSLLNRTIYEIKVKNWMSNSSANLDFHNRWNNGVAMPSNIMRGEILDETPGMWKMSLVDDKNNKWVGFVSKVAVIEMKEVYNSE